LAARVFTSLGLSSFLAVSVKTEDPRYYKIAFLLGAPYRKYC